MIFADAGYGLLLGILLILSWRTLSNTRSNVRLRNLFLALVIASIGYGVMLGSYFGVSPAEGRFLASLKVLNADDQPGMMLLSIIVGAFHLILARASANSILYKIINILNDILEESREELYQSAKRRNISFQAHLKIVEAIERQDPELAWQEMNHHLIGVESIEFNSTEKSK